MIVLHCGKPKFISLRERAPLKSTSSSDYVSRIDLSLLSFYLETLPML